MFFEIQHHTNLDYPNNYQLNQQFYLNCDSGWTKYSHNNKQIYFKGYHTTSLTDDDFVKLLAMDDVPKYSGLFIAVIVSSDSIVVSSDIDRGYPIYYKENPTTITNIPFTVNENGNWDNHSEKMLYSIQQIGIENDSIVTKNYDPFSEYGNFSKLSESEVINKIDEQIRYNFETILSKNNKPIKIFLSGGLDSLLVYAYLKSFTNNFEIVKGERIDFTKFICKKIYNIRRIHWLPIIHHFNGPCLNVVGGFGDMRMLRMPRLGNLLLAANNLSTIDIAEEYKNSYQYNSMVNESSRKIYQSQQNEKCIHDLNATYEKIYNISIHVYGHWHIEENILFNPLKDLKLLNYCLRAPLDLQIGQIFDGQITKLLFEKTDPDLLKYISPIKNVHNMRDMWELYEKYDTN